MAGWLGLSKTEFFVPPIVVDAAIVFFIVAALMQAKKAFFVSFVVVDVVAVVGVAIHGFMLILMARLLFKALQIHCVQFQ